MSIGLNTTSKSLAAAFSRNFIRDSVDFSIHSIFSSNEETQEINGKEINFQNSTIEFSSDEDLSNINPKDQSIRESSASSSPYAWKNMNRKELIDDFIQKLDVNSGMEIVSELFNQSYFISEILHGKFGKIIIDVELLTKYEEVLKDMNFIEQNSLFTSSDVVRGKLLMDSERKKAEENKKPKTLKDWGGMVKQKLTPELELQLKAYKLSHAASGGGEALEDEITTKDLPRYFQFGTIVDDASNFFQRKGKKRKTTFLDALVEEQKEIKYVKERYAQIQAKLHKESRLRHAKRRKVA